MKTLFLLILMTIIVLCTDAQVQSNSRHQKGINIGTQIGLRNETGFMMKLFVNVGYGYELNFAFPNTHLGFAYNIKTLSTKQEKKQESNKYKTNTSVEFIGGILSGFRFGPWNSKSLWTKDMYKGQPYYSYSNLNESALMHPFHSSISIGTQYILTKDNKRVMSQRVGLLNIKIHHFQLFYQNDGAIPFSIFGKTLINHKKDRFYTSSVLASWHFAEERFAQINSISLSFNKFTTDAGDGYLIANSMRNNTVYYKDQEQYSYNLSFIGLGVKLNDLAEFSVRKYNPDGRIDPQNLIHYESMPYHMNSTVGHWGGDVQRSIKFN